MTAQGCGYHYWLGCLWYQNGRSGGYAGGGHAILWVCLYCELRPYVPHRTRRIGNKLVLWLWLVSMQMESKLALSISQGWSLGEASSGGLSVLQCMVAEWFAWPQWSQFAPLAG